MIKPELAADIYYRLNKIRLVEEAIVAEYKHQQMRCPVHLSIGQEAIAVGALTCFNHQDVIFSTHRCHSHYLGKGGDLNSMIAELYGKRNGCAKGLGGSMHLIDRSCGFMGAVPILASSIPIGVGAAFGSILKKTPHVSVIFFGDGAMQESQ